MKARISDIARDGIKLIICSVTYTLNDQKAKPQRCFLQIIINTAGYIALAIKQYRLASYHYSYMAKLSDQNNLMYIYNFYNAYIKGYRLLGLASL